MYNITRALKLRLSVHVSLLTSNTSGSFLHAPPCLLSSGQNRCHSATHSSPTGFLSSQSTSTTSTAPFEEPQRQESAVHRGTAFENRSLRILHQHLSMDLRRVGGKSDGGIDLQGWWWVPFSSHTTPTSMQCPTRKGDSDGIISPLPTPHIPDERRRIRVFAQCKMEKKKIGPKYIREMEGVLTRHFHRDDPSQSESQSHEDPIVGLFISSSPFTKSALLRAYSSPIPFMLLHLPPLVSHPRLGENVSVGRGVDEEEDIQETSRSELGSIVCNSTLLGRDGILQGEIEPRWERSPDGVGEGRPGLWYRGKRVVSWRPEEGHDSRS